MTLPSVCTWVTNGCKKWYNIFNNPHRRKYKEDKQMKPTSMRKCDQKMSDTKW